ncbi:MAG TPA: hypothetical protein VN882_05035 [Steroidobacteraceae bacterium]|nr:hypothetical protein [Steroidobacteraceae bacterium]
MEREHELLAQLAAQIAAGMIARLAGAPLDDKAVVKGAMDMARIILEAAKGPPRSSYFGASPKPK